MPEQWNHDDMNEAYNRARALRAAYIRAFFTNLFRRRPADREVAIGHHAAAH